MYSYLSALTPTGKGAFVLGASFEPGINTSLQYSYSNNTASKAVWEDGVEPISAPGTGGGRRLDRGGITRPQRDRL